METLAFLLLVSMQRNNAGVVSVSMELFDYGYLVTTRVLHINDGLRSNTSQYIINCIARLEIFTAVTMKNVVFWGIKTQFLIHRRHIASPLQSNQLMLCQI
jgi:hypothetical protein